MMYQVKPSLVESPLCASTQSWYGTSQLLKMVQQQWERFFGAIDIAQLSSLDHRFSHDKSYSGSARIQG